MEHHAQIIAIHIKLIIMELAKVNLIFHIYKIVVLVVIHVLHFNQAIVHLVPQAIFYFQIIVALQQHLIYKEIFVNKAVIQVLFK